MLPYPYHCRRVLIFVSTGVPLHETSGPLTRRVANLAAQFTLLRLVALLRRHLTWEDARRNLYTRQRRAYCDSAKSSSGVPGSP